MSDWKAALRAGLGGVGLLAALAVMWRVRALWVPFALALALAYVLEPLVGALERREVPRSAGILVAYLALGLLAGLAWVYFGPALYRELEALAGRLPEQSQRLQAQAGQWMERLALPSLPEPARLALGAALERLQGLLAAFAGRVGELLVGLVSQVFNLVLAPVLAYYILKDREALAGALLGLMPPAWRPAAMRLALEVDQTLAAVIRGQLIISMTVGAVVAAGLALLQVRYALVLGLLTGVLDVIPYFGPVAAAVPIVGLSWLDSPWTALWAVALLVAANQLESLVLQPKVMSRSTGLHPLSVIAAVMAGAELGGVAGMLAAVPVAATLRTLLRRWSQWVASAGQTGQAARSEGAVPPLRPPAAR